MKTINRDFDIRELFPDVLLGSYELVALVGLMHT